MSRAAIRANLAAYHEMQRRADEARWRKALETSYGYARCQWQRWSPEWQARLAAAMEAQQPIAELLADACADCPPLTALSEATP